MFLVHLAFGSAATIFYFEQTKRKGLSVHPDTNTKLLQLSVTDLSAIRLCECNNFDFVTSANDFRDTRCLLEYLQFISEDLVVLHTL